MRGHSPPASHSRRSRRTRTRCSRCQGSWCMNGERWPRTGPAAARPGTRWPRVWRARRAVPSSCRWEARSYGCDRSSEPAASSRCRRRGSDGRECRTKSWTIPCAGIRSRGVRAGHGTSSTWWIAYPREESVPSHPSRCPWLAGSIFGFSWGSWDSTGG